jgi:tRNA-dihydrouridine synthase
MSDVPAHWDIIREVVKMRNRLKSKTLIIGNGDVVSLADAQEKYKKYGVDGVMVGRALFGTPWFFVGRGTNSLSLSLRVPPKQSDYNEIATPSHLLIGAGARRGLSRLQSNRESSIKSGLAMTKKNKLKLALEHTKLFEKIFKGKKHFDIMKKHYKAYISGFDDAKKMRMRLMNVKNFKEAEIALKKVITGL